MNNDNKKGKIIQNHDTVLVKSQIEKIPGDIQKCWEGSIKYKFLRTCIRSTHCEGKRGRKLFFLLFR